MALVEYEQRGSIAYITLNRPEKLNAISDALSLELRDALFRLDDDKEAFVGIVSGKGRAFCSGADVQQRQLRTHDELERLGGPVGRGVSVSEPVFRSTNAKPLIAAVHGYVLGGGLRMALLSDLLVASEGTQFQITETRRGVSGNHFWAFLAQRASGGFADDVAITGRFWSAEEGAAKGMVHRLAKPGEHVKVAEEVAAEILKNPPLAVRAAVRDRRAILEKLDVQAHATRPHHLHLTEDFREAALAFNEKRKPVCRGR